MSRRTREDGPSGWRTALGILAAILVLDQAPAAQEEERDPRRERASAELVPELEELADWCQSQRLYGARDNVYRALLHFDEDHKDARRMLQYSRGRDGEWIRKRRYRVPKDRNAQALVEYQEQMEGISFHYRRQIAHLLGEGASEGVLADNELTGVWGDLLALDPDDADIRTMLGEVRNPEEDGPRWILKETAAATEKRKRLREVAQRAMAKTPPAVDARGLAYLDELGLRWRKAVVADDFVIVGTGSAGEPLECAQYVQATEALFLECFPGSQGIPGSYLIYLLESKAQKRNFIASHRAFYGAEAHEAREYDSFWVPGTARLVVACKDREDRLDQVVRQTICLLLRHNYDICEARGWATEGVGIFLTRLLLGEDKSTARGKSKLSRPGSLSGDRVSDHDVSLGSARHLMAKEPHAGWRELGRKEVRELEPNELLYSYALVRYLVEGRPDKVHDVFRLTERKVPLEGALERVLGRDIDGMEARIQRWLEEMPEDKRVRPPTK